MSVRNCAHLNHAGKYNAESLTESFVGHTVQGWIENDGDVGIVFDCDWVYFPTRNSKWEPDTLYRYLKEFDDREDTAIGRRRLAYKHAGVEDAREKA